VAIAGADPALAEAPVNAALGGSSSGHPFAVVLPPVPSKKEAAVVAPNSVKPLGSWVMTTFQAGRDHPASIAEAPNMLNEYS